MWVIYDKEADVLRMGSGQPIKDTSGLLRGPDAAVDMATDGGCDVVGFILTGASAYLPLGLGYDPERDVLTIGETTDDPDLVTENGDFVGYWEVYVAEPGGVRLPVGVAVRRASMYLKKVLSELTERDFFHYTVRD